MRVRELSIAGAFELTPEQHHDERGVFLEYFRQDVLRDITGRTLDLQQGNCSVSQAGVLRGVHYADVPPGQAKYVTAVSGSFMDVIVDLRVGSATFGQWDAVKLDTIERRGVFVPEGLGHAAMALDDGSTLMYLCSTSYAPDREHVVHALDPQLAIPWPVPPKLSARDKTAPLLAEAEAQGRLPRASDVRSFLADLAT